MFCLFGLHDYEVVETTERGYLEQCRNCPKLIFVKWQKRYRDEVHGINGF